MRRDLIIAFIIVASAHITLAVVPQLFKSGPQRIKRDEDTTIQIQLPPPPPLEEIDDVKPLDAETPTMTPPSLVDMPTVVPVDAFVTPPEPPPPPTLGVGSVISVPVTHSNFQGAKIFNLADLDQQPQPILQPEPQVPFEVRRQGIGGSVTVGFICDTLGNVVEPYVIHTSGQHELDQAATQGVTKWRFKPGKKGGQPANARMEVVITFNIEQ
jgi:periplasmic protein TonB